MFSGMFSYIFFLSMMRLFLSLLQGAVIFLFPEKKGIYRNLGFFKLKCQGVHERVGFIIFLS
jgi:hypothetical protein